MATAPQASTGPRRPGPNVATSRGTYGPLRDHPTHRFRAVVPRDRLHVGLSPVVLVLDGEQRAALAVVRSLGRHGCTVQVGSAVPRSLAGGSRFAAGEVLLPDPLAGSRAYAQAVENTLARTGAQIVLPMTEGATLALLEHRDRLGAVSLPTSDLTRFRHASDKEAVLALGQQLGLAVPAQWTTSGDPADFPAIPADQYPIVIKPARSVVGGDGQRRKVSVEYAHTPDQLEQTLRDLGRAAGPFLVQAKLEGPGLGVFLLRWGGTIHARFAHRRIREKPPSGGVSVCCESVAPPVTLLAQSTALLEALDWNGVAMIEFKHDVRSGRSYLMEINPRFWGSLQLAIDAGVDFPWYLVQLALGVEPAPPAPWRVGVRSRWLWGDIDHLIARLRHSRAALDLPDDAPGLLRTVVDVLTPFRPGQRSDVFRLSDPLPAWRESLAWFRDLAR